MAKSVAKNKFTSNQAIIKALQSCLGSSGIDHAVVAFSGGMDSHVLLDALATHFPELLVEAVHINHQQSPHASKWEEHAKSICAQLKIPCSSVCVNPTIKPGDSLEARLRDARYAEFKKHISSEKKGLFLAHHADDQVETMLLRLLRGAGPAGLGAMQERQPFERGQLLRPLLSLPKESLMDYAQHRQLQWVEDESNHNESFDRNYLRQSVVPLLQKRWPGLNKTIPRAALLCRETQVLLDEVAQVDGVSAVNPLPWKSMQMLTQSRQANALRHWLCCLELCAPSQIQLHTFLKQVITAAADRVPTLQLNCGTVRYYRGKLYYSIQEGNQLFSFQWGLSESLKLPVGQLVVCEEKGKGLSREKLLLPITVKTRQGGERLKQGNSACHQRLKNCWQQWGVPPWLRESYPLLYQGNELLAVPGYGYAAEFAAKPDEIGLVINFEGEKQ